VEEAILYMKGGMLMDRESCTCTRPLCLALSAGCTKNGSKLENEPRGRTEAERETPPGEAAALLSCGDWQMRRRKRNHIGLTLIADSPGRYIIAVRPLSGDL